MVEPTGYGLVDVSSVEWANIFFLVVTFLLALVLGEGHPPVTEDF